MLVNSNEVKTAVHLSHLVTLVLSQIFLDTRAVITEKLILFTLVVYFFLLVPYLSARIDAGY